MTPLFVPPNEFYVIRLANGNYFSTQNPNGCHFVRTSLFFAGPFERASVQVQQFMKQYELPADCTLVRVSFTTEDVMELIR